MGIETAGRVDYKSRKSPRDIVIRAATPADYDAIRRITRDSYLQAGYFDDADDPYMRVLQDVEDRAEKALLWVAEVDGSVAGSLLVTFAGRPYADVARDDEIEFRMLAVDPHRQRSGVGRALVTAVIEHGRSLDGIDAVALTTGETMVQAHRLYESMGFTRIHDRDWVVPDVDEVINLWVFRRDLAE